MNREVDEARREVEVDLTLIALRKEIDELKKWFLWFLRGVAGVICAMAYLYLQTMGLVP